MRYDTIKKNYTIVRELQGVGCMSFVGGWVLRGRYRMREIIIKVFSLCRKTLTPSNFEENFGEDENGILRKIHYSFCSPPFSVCFLMRYLIIHKNQFREFNLLPWTLLLNFLINPHGNERRELGWVGSASTISSQYSCTFLQQFYGEHENEWL